MRGQDAAYGYDRTSPASIEKFAKRLVGHTFSDAVGSADLPGSGGRSGSNKGSLGQLLEACYFRYRINSDPGPDFREAGVELKVTPFKRDARGEAVAKERLVLTMINYMEAVREKDLYESHLWKKCRLILLVYYEFIKELDRLDFPIRYVRLFTPSADDLKIIEKDYKDIIGMIASGKAEELSERRTLYLGACPKGRDSSDTVSQPFSDRPAMRRAFCFKQSYMTAVLNNVLIPGAEADLGDSISYEGDSFTDSVLAAINRHSGKTVAQLMGETGVSYSGNRPKNLESTLALRILGVRSGKAEQFVKAGVSVKTIRLEPDGSLKETVSFPAFDFIRLSQEEWETAEINSLLTDTRFFFVVFQKDGLYESFRKRGDQAAMDRHLRLSFAVFWIMPEEDIKGHVYPCWLRTRAMLREGVRVRTEAASGGRTRRLNNLPKISEDSVIHVRPHGRDSSDTLPLPAPTIEEHPRYSFPKQSFFLNRKYVLEQVMKARDASRPGNGSRRGGSLRGR